MFFQEKPLPPPPPPFPPFLAAVLFPPRPYCVCLSSFEKEEWGDRQPLLAWTSQPCLTLSFFPPFLLARRPARLSVKCDTQ